MTALSREINNISHSDLTRYLKSKKWEKVEDWSKKGVMDAYRHEKHLIEVMVDETLPSYVDRLRQTVISLAYIEDKKSEELLKEIENSKVYSIRVKANTPNHKIRLDESIALRTGIQKAFLASAHSAITPSIDIKRMNGKDPGVISSHLWDDQTEAASYIANFRSPKITSGDLDSATVIKTFCEGILTVKEASKEDTLPGKSQYTRLAEKGISRQFLDSLRMLNLKESMAQQVEIEINDITHQHSQKVVFEEKDFNFIQDFYDTVSKTSEDEAEVSGTITGCHSPNQEAGGEIRISAVIDGSLKSVKVKLDKNDFDSATVHFANSRSRKFKAEVKITGLLRIRPRSVEIVDVSKLELSQPPN